MTRDGGTETLTYGLYIDPTHNIAWGTERAARLS